MLDPHFATRKHLSHTRTLDTHHRTNGVRLRVPINGYFHWRWALNMGRIKCNDYLTHPARGASALFSVGSLHTKAQQARATWTRQRTTGRPDDNSISERGSIPSHAHFNHLVSSLLCPRKQRGHGYKPCYPLCFVEPPHDGLPPNLDTPTPAVSRIH